jgi:hypothetical protein
MGAAVRHEGTATGLDIMGAAGTPEDDDLR